MERSVLKELGFSEGEAEIYLALIKKGKASIMQLSKTTGRHRTHIYDTVEKLKEKGLIAESVIYNKRFLIASPPENILYYLKETQEKAESVVSELKKFEKIIEKDVKVETYKGTAGLKIILRDILREKKDYVGYGEGVRFEKVLPAFYEQFRKQSEKSGLGLRLIVKTGVEIPKRKKLTVKFLGYVSPSTTFVYADKIAIFIWEPFPTVIKITDIQVADSYRNYFEILWRSAK